MISTAVAATEQNVTDEGRKLLIDCIKPKAIIWDPTHDNHSKRTEINLAYVSIADEMTALSDGSRTLSASLLKSVRKKLTDSYKYYKRSRENSTQKGADDPTVKWLFFTLMMFMDTPPSFASQSEHVVTLNKIPANSTSSADLEIAEQASTPLEDTPRLYRKRLRLQIASVSRLPDPLRRRRRMKMLVILLVC